MTARGTRRLRSIKNGGTPWSPYINPADVVAMDVSRPGSRVLPEVYEHVMRRDNYTCQGPAVGMVFPCRGGLELDHIRNGGMGLRGPSDPSNLVALCSGTHHRTKTEGARIWRPLLTEHVRERESRLSPDHCSWEKHPSNPSVLSPTPGTTP